LLDEKGQHDTPSGILSAGKIRSVIEDSNVADIFDPDGISESAPKAPPVSTPIIIRHSTSPMLHIVDIKKDRLSSITETGCDTRSEFRL